MSQVRMWDAEAGPDSPWPGAVIIARYETPIIWEMWTGDGDDGETPELVVQFGKDLLDESEPSAWEVDLPQELGGGVIIIDFDGDRFVALVDDVVVASWTAEELDIDGYDEEYPT